VGGQEGVGTPGHRSGDFEDPLNCHEDFMLATSNKCYMIGAGG
jgi:hypothetical protein